MAPPTKTSIALANGRYFDHLAPDPDAIDLDVIELGLQVPRFNNQTIRPITVAEHSLRVWRFVRALGGGEVSQLRALLHDAPEALVPWGDCLRPGKTDEMREVERHVMAAIWDALKLPSREMMDGYGERGAIVTQADLAACGLEALIWQRGAEDWALDLLGEDWKRLLCEVYPRPDEDWRTEVERLLG